MHIIHVTGFYPPHVGGAEYRTKDLAEIFAKDGHRVEVLTSDIGCAKGKVTSNKNLTVHYLKSLEIAHTPIMFSLPFKLFQIPKDSIIHLHIAHAFLAEVTFFMATLRKIPYIAHVHLDVEKSGTFGFLLPIYKRIFLKKVLQRAQKVTVLTPDYKKIIHDKYHVENSKIVIIPNGTFFSNKERTTNKLHRPTRILFVGRLTVQKNIPLLIRAISICVKEYKLPILLQIAGEGELRKQLIQLIAELNVNDNVKLLGSVTPKQAQKLYVNSDIFIMPSKSESFGSVIIESMASGTPVIATNIPGVRNIIQDTVNGLLVKENPVDLARAIAQVYKSAKLQKILRENGLQTAKKYSWSHVASLYQEVYESSLRSRNK